MDAALVAGIKPALVRLVSVCALSAAIESPMYEEKDAWISRVQSAAPRWCGSRKRKI